MANIERRKNQKLLIESIKEYPEYKLVIIGHVRDHAYYKECGIDENDQVLLRRTYCTIFKTFGIGV